MNKCLFYFLIIAAPGFIFAQDTLEECTIGVAVGSATSDGRPLIWKTRDYSSEPDNELILNTTYIYDFLEIINAGETKAWMGVNEHGFAILNSLAPDLTPGNSLYTNGGLNREALGTCVTIADFQDLLDQTNSSNRWTQGNFAVLDSSGSAAIFEISGDAYWKFDAGDSLIAPSGFIIRTNFAENGDGISGSGYERYTRSSDLVTNFHQGDSLNYRSLLRYQMRDFSDFNSKPVTVPFANIWTSGRPFGYIYTNVSICRSSSVSAAVIRGILPGEPATLSTMWVILGQPAASIATPYWPVGPTPAEANGTVTAPLCDIALQIKSQLFDYSENTYYIDSYKLRDKKGGGLWITTFPVEDSIFTEAERIIEDWRAEYPPVSEILAIQSGFAKDAWTTLVSAYDQMILSLAVTSESEVPGKFQLDQNFPNPFNMSTVFRFTIPEAGFVSLKIYDLLGKTITTVIETDYPLGYHEVAWNAATVPGLASGIYFCKLTVSASKDYAAIRKVAFIK